MLNVTIEDNLKDNGDLPLNLPCENCGKQAVNATMADVKAENTVKCSNCGAEVHLKNTNS